MKKYVKTKFFVELKFYQRRVKVTYANVEFLTKKRDGRANNPKKYSAIKTGNHIP